MCGFKHEVVGDLLLGTRQDTCGIWFDVVEGYGLLGMLFMGVVLFVELFLFSLYVVGVYRVRTTKF